MVIKITRYNPRRDKENLEALVKDFEYKTGAPIDLEKFSKHIEERAKNLVYRNSIILAMDDNNLVGAGCFSMYTDFLGEQVCIIHDVITRKEDSFKKGIEELILRELFVYIKKTVQLEKCEFIVQKKDSNFQSLLLKLKIRENPNLKIYKHIL